VMQGMYDTAMHAAEAMRAADGADAAASLLAVRFGRWVASLLKQPIETRLNPLESERTFLEARLEALLGLIAGGPRLPARRTKTTRRTRASSLRT
jgi:hypothetical protein